MSEIRKTIQINPQYLIHDKKGGRKKKARNKVKPNLNIQPNGIRDKLIQKIKDHRHRQNSIKQNAVNNQDGGDPFKSSLEYLNSVIQKSETKKQRKQRRRKKQQQQPHNITAKIRHNDDPPWGILKNGKKPLYSEYKRTLRKLDGEKRPIQQKSIHYEKPIIPATSLISERKSKLTELKNNLNISNRKKRRENRTLKKKKKKRYTLGKHGDSIGILIKSKATRKKIKREHKNLKKKKIKDIKLYLKKHGLMKVGSHAPEELCRNIYETAVLSGEIYNNNANLLLHNFINDK
jgi:chromosome segregation ATPase